MNTARLIQLADHIERLPRGSYSGGFNMRYYRHECGSPSCIAGHAIAMFGAKSKVRTRFGLTFEIAAALLELDESEARWLFFAGWVDALQAPVRLQDIPPKVAANSIRALVAGSPKFELWGHHEWCLACLPSLRTGGSSIE